MWSIGPAYYGQRAEGWTTRFAPHLARKLLVACCGCLIGKRFCNATTRWSSPFIKKYIRLVGLLDATNQGRTEGQQNPWVQVQELGIPHGTYNYE